MIFLNVRALVWCRNLVRILAKEVNSETDGSDAFSYVRVSELSKMGSDNSESSSTKSRKFRCDRIRLVLLFRVQFVRSQKTN